MDTPSPGTQGHMQQQNSMRQNIGPKFCRECSNMLYPKENKVEMALMYQCRTCSYTEPASSYCVYRNQLASSAGETAGVTTDVGSDPTLPRSNKQCPKCEETECVFFQSQMRKEETKMKLFYVCCSCGHIFE
ncbi:hypothetical protein EV426DRAFT_274655 [Tirmania nivea]|nr:hypothetical protein EV426DRAFT_274655 [Tirmania nivea]